MVRAVCVNCHGVGFALAALADPKLVRNAFAGRPGLPQPSLEMVRKRRSVH
jgi:hypothetical protein